MTRQRVLEAIGRSGAVVWADPRPLPECGRYVLVERIDEDGLSDRRAVSCDTLEEARRRAAAPEEGWWPDVVIDTAAPIDRSVRDAATGDGSLGEARPFDEDHVVFA